MPLRSRTFSDLRFIPPERHPRTIRGMKIGTVGGRMSASASLVCTWGTRGRTKSPRTCGPRQPPPCLLQGKGTRCRPLSVEEATQ
jgi:hypothetical protein